MPGNQDHVTVNPGVLGGKPVIKGTRIPVHLVLELFASGMSEEKVLKEYPELSSADIRAALEYAAKVLRKQESISVEA